MPGTEMQSIISLISVIHSDSRVFERLRPPDISRILNRDLRHVFQSACASSHDGLAFSLFSSPLLSGIPETRNTYCQLTAPVHPVFGWNDGDLPIPGGDIEEITVIILSQKGTHQDYLKD
jgi:hypothetical protein